MDCLIAQLQFNPFLLAPLDSAAGTLSEVVFLVIVHRACPACIYVHVAHLSNRFNALLGLLHTVTSQGLCSLELFLAQHVHCGLSCLTCSGTHCLRSP